MVSTSKETKLIRVYCTDDKMLQQYMAYVMLEKRERISMAEAVHVLVEKFVKPIVDKALAVEG